VVSVRYEIHDAKEMGKVTAHKGLG
jgi:hypothetical protein